MNCGDDDSVSDADTDTDTDTEIDTETESEVDTSGYIYFEDFEDYEAGDYIVQTAGDPWITWSNPSEPGEDAQVSGEQALNGTKSLKDKKRERTPFIALLNEFNRSLASVSGQLGRRGHSGRPWSDKRFHLEVACYKDYRGTPPHGILPTFRTSR